MKTSALALLFLSMLPLPPVHAETYNFEFGKKKMEPPVSIAAISEGNSKPYYFRFGTGAAMNLSFNSSYTAGFPYAGATFFAAVRLNHDLDLEAFFAPLVYTVVGVELDYHLVQTSFNLGRQIEFELLGKLGISDLPVINGFPSPVHLGLYAGFYHPIGLGFFVSSRFGYPFFHNEAGLVYLLH